MVRIFLYLRVCIVGVPSNLYYTRGNPYFKFKLLKYTFVLLENQYPNPYKRANEDSFANIVPNKTELRQNYPNPFNPLTIINYSVAENSFVSLSIYDVLGNKVADLVKGMKEAGSYTISFDGSQLSSGIYLYVLRANNYSISKKMILAK